MDKTDKIDELFRYVRGSESELSIQYVKEYDTFLLKMTRGKIVYDDTNQSFKRENLTSYQTLYPDEIHRIFPDVLSIMVADLDLQEGGL